MKSSETGISVKIKKVSPLAGTAIPLPAYTTPGAAAMDLYACCNEPVVIPARGRERVSTGIAIELPGPGVVALVFPRSGLASKHGISLSNAVGVIDSDYRGEIICLMQNESELPFTVQPGDRIAQLGFFPIYQAVWDETAELGGSERGSGGFGSTGISQAPFRLKNG